MASDPIVYCLTRDRELATAIDDRISGAIAFFFNDAARLHQAVTLRAPDLVLVDTGAVRAEYGDAGLGPVFDFLRQHAPAARLALRPPTAVGHLAAAEAGSGVDVLAPDVEGCVGAIVAAAARA
jgi:hypothetical protein